MNEIDARSVAADAMYRHDQGVIDDARVRSRFSREKADAILRQNSEETATIILAAFRDADWSVVKLRAVGRCCETEHTCCCEHTFDYPNDLPQGDCCEPVYRVTAGESP